MADRLINVMLTRTVRKRGRNRVETNHTSLRVCDTLDEDAIRERVNAHVAAECGGWSLGVWEAVGMHRCAGSLCPGYSWRASDHPHPTSCVGPRGL